VTGDSLRLASALMRGFANATGVTGEAPPLRYLWTDAFAVCNFLGLHSATGQGEYRELALRLLDQVHHVLGRHRDDDARLTDRDPADPMPASLGALLIRGRKSMNEPASVAVGVAIYGHDARH
jgi:hypothetical protein